MATENNYILKSNLEIALRHAIEGLEIEEMVKGYNSDSALLAGWKKSLEALKNGTLEIR